MVKLSDNDDIKDFVKRRYPGAIALGSDTGSRVAIFDNRSNERKRLCGWCDTDEGAWRAAARRLGWRPKR